MLGMGLTSKLRDGWSHQLCASLLAKVLRCRLVFGVIRRDLTLMCRSSFQPGCSVSLSSDLARSRHQNPKLQTPNFTRNHSGQINSWSPGWSPGWSPWNLNTTTHGHPWPMTTSDAADGSLESRSPGASLDQPGRGNQRDQPDGFQRPVGGNLRRAPEGAETWKWGTPARRWFRAVSLEIALLVVYGIWMDFLYPSNLIMDFPK